MLIYLIILILITGLIITIPMILIIIVLLFDNGMAILCDRVLFLLFLNLSTRKCTK